MMKRLGRAVARRGEAVGPQAHPRQESNERDVMEDPLVAKITCATDEQGLDVLRQ